MNLEKVWTAMMAFQWRSWWTGYFRPLGKNHYYRNKISLLNKQNYIADKNNRFWKVMTELDFNRELEYRECTSKILFYVEDATKDRYRKDKIDTMKRGLETSAQLCRWTIFFYSVTCFLLMYCILLCSFVSIWLALLPIIRKLWVTWLGVAHR